MGFVFDQFQTSKPFTARGLLLFVELITQGVCWCKRCSKCERKNRYVENRNLLK